MPSVSIVTGRSGRGKFTVRIAFLHLLKNQLSMASLALQRSKQRLEDDGWRVWKVETYNQWSGQRSDLYNLMDIVAFKATVEGVLGIQCCSGDAPKHIEKYIVGYTDAKGIFHGPNEYLPIWKASGNRFIIHDWTKRCQDGQRGKRKVWQLREIEL